MRINKASRVHVNSLQKKSAGLDDELEDVLEAFEGVAQVIVILLVVRFVQVVNENFGQFPSKLKNTLGNIASNAATWKLNFDRARKDEE